jgi:hypothetical protein
MLRLLQLSQPLQGAVMQLALLCQLCLGRLRSRQLFCQLAKRLLVCLPCHLELLGMPLHCRQAGAGGQVLLTLAGQLCRQRGSFCSLMLNLLPQRLQLLLLLLLRHLCCRRSCYCCCCRRW